MANPILIEVTRGRLIESAHRGAIAVVDASGIQRAAIGDISKLVFPRSAVKLIQALPLVESDAADAYGFGNRELAIACASHSGEAAHVAIAASMLERAGHTAADLECGIQMPTDADAAQNLIRSGQEPSSLHNNCSGKHAGFVCVSKHLGIPIEGYVAEHHPVQREVTAALQDLTGESFAADVCAVDGCSIPTYGIPLNRLAHAFARIATGQGMAPRRAAAARRLWLACTEEPFVVGGTKRFCSEVLRVFAGDVFIKVGAEGVYCGAIASLGFGIALKCDDGSVRGCEAMMAATLSALLMPSGEAFAALRKLAPSRVETRRGVKVGEIRPVEGLFDAIRDGRAAA